MSENNLVFVCERGQIGRLAKQDLRAAGIIVVEAKDPDKCKFLRADEVLSGDALSYAALSALMSNKTYATDAQAELGMHLLNAMKKQRESGDTNQ